MKKERLKKSIKSGLVALVMGAGSLTGGLCKDKSNAVRLCLKYPGGGIGEVFNFDITPDNPWFDEEGRKIVEKFRADSSTTGIWVDADARLELRTAIAKMVTDQIKTKIGPVKTWGNADDRKAKLFKILSLIVSECARVYLRAGRDQKYEKWITGDTSQDRLNLFWISWMVNNLMWGFQILYHDPDIVDYDGVSSSNTPSTTARFFSRLHDNPLCDFYKGGLRAGGYLLPTTINHLYCYFNYNSYKKYFDRLINWNITDVSSSTKVSRWLNERLEQKLEIRFNQATPKSLYPVVDPNYKGQKITRDQFLDGDLLNLSNGNKLIFEVLDDNVQIPQQKMSMSNPMVQKPQVKPAIRSQNSTEELRKSLQQRKSILKSLQNKSNKSKPKDFERETTIDVKMGINLSNYFKRRLKLNEPYKISLSSDGCNFCFGEEIYELENKVEAFPIKIYIEYACNGNTHRELVSVDKNKIYEFVFKPDHVDINEIEPPKTSNTISDAPAEQNNDSKANVNVSIAGETKSILIEKNEPTELKIENDKVLISNESFDIGSKKLSSKKLIGCQIEYNKKKIVKNINKSNVYVIIIDDDNNINWQAKRIERKTDLSVQKSQTDNIDMNINVNLQTDNNNSEIPENTEMKEKKSQTDDKDSNSTNMNINVNLQTDNNDSEIPENTEMKEEKFVDESPSNVLENGNTSSSDIPAEQNNDSKANVNVSIAGETKSILIEKNEPTELKIENDKVLISNESFDIGSKKMVGCQIEYSNNKIMKNINKSNVYVIIIDDDNNINWQAKRIERKVDSSIPKSQTDNIDMNINVNLQTDNNNSEIPENTEMKEEKFVDESPSNVLENGNTSDIVTILAPGLKIGPCKLEYNKEYSLDLTSLPKKEIVTISTEDSNISFSYQLEPGKYKLKITQNNIELSIIQIN